ncbi:hypothetical protein [Sulfuricurvum sp.]|uniref:hypothetical protein n=1 Tax=Sulfuricurvum sp. TaxID=2025608 RepID=UPI003567264E
MFYIPKFISWFYYSVEEKQQYADLPFNSFVHGHDMGVDPDNAFFSPVTLDDLSFVLDCEKNNYFSSDIVGSDYFEEACDV